MSEIIELQTLLTSTASPFKVSKSTLGITTKVMSDKFVCSMRELSVLFEQVREKLGYYNPSEVSFQYLVSFTDQTHFENSDIQLLEKNLSSSGKSTDKLILTWTVTHEIDGEENELSFTIRISNPINPFIMLQAVLSKSPGDFDNLEMASGSVSISVNGATQTASEEIFELVARWVKSCPQPQNITKINSFLTSKRDLIQTANSWLMPILYAIACYLVIKAQPAEDSISVTFIFICGFLLLRTAINKVNSMIERWCQISRTFSLFMLTGGDSNQQTMYSAVATSSTFKLIISTVTSFALNVAAGIFVLFYIAP